MAAKACVTIEVIVMGPIDNNVYVVSDGTSTLVVDPTQDAPHIMKVLGDRKLDAIVLTHFHWDHVGAAKELHDLSGATTIASAVDAPVIDGRKELGPGHMRFELCEIDREVADGDVLDIGAMRWRVMATPGHTPGSMCLFLDPRYGSDPEGAPVLIAGDTLFAGAHGRTDFEGGSPADMRESLKKLAGLPSDTLVLTGHNDLTTIGREQSWLVHGGF